MNLFFGFEELNDIDMINPDFAFNAIEIFLLFIC